MNESLSNFKGYYSTEEKAYATLSYLTGGLVGIILILLKHAESHFLKFHIYQSLALSLLCFLVTSCLDILARTIGLALFFLGPLATLVKIAVYTVMAFVPLVFLCVVIYCIIMAWKDQYSKIKGLSEQIHALL